MRLLLLRSNDVWSVVLTILFIPRAFWLFPSTGREFELKTSPHFSAIPRDTFSLSTLSWCPASFFYIILLLPFFLTDPCRIHRSCVSKAAMRGFVPCCLTMSWRMRVVSCWCCLPEEWLSSIRGRSRWKLPAGSRNNSFVFIFHYTFLQDWR